MKSYPIMWGWLYERWYIYLLLPWIYAFPRILVISNDSIRLRQKHKPIYHTKQGLLGGGFKHFFISPRNLGKIRSYFFQMGWNFNHQLGLLSWFFLEKIPRIGLDFGGLFRDWLAQLALGSGVFGHEDIRSWWFRNPIPNQLGLW